MRICLICFEQTKEPLCEYCNSERLHAPTVELSIYLSNLPFTRFFRTYVFVRDNTVYPEETKKRMLGNLDKLMTTFPNSPERKAKRPSKIKRLLRIG